TPALREAGRRSVSAFSEKDDNLAWQRILHRRGWAAPSWPVEHGGPGWGEMQRYIFAAELALAEAPSLSPMGLKMVGPCIMRFGTPEQKAFY
ncbi:acyl-CoA dehydrogenase, partial [Pseudomonas sp. GW531-E2]|uniref:acyl-CoA dehydrogenase family protein n=1 Tax=Pseudomonas sp. GW531-E2 TaxID=2070679 RepID=UPI000CAB45F9